MKKKKQMYTNRETRFDMTNITDVFVNDNKYTNSKLIQRILLNRDTERFYRQFSSGLLIPHTFYKCIYVSVKLYVHLYVDILRK